jgi:aminoglycoside phosphotransferase (APT) family kinase protein
LSEAPSGPAQRLEKALQSDAKSLGVQRVESVERLTSGLSSQSYRVEALTEAGPTTWVMRVEPEFGVIPPYDITREFRLLEDVGRAGLPVPRMLHLCEDKSVVGGRFLLMSFIEGEIYRSKDPRIEGDPALCASVQEQFVEMLARVHATEQKTLPLYASGPEASRAHVAICRDRMRRTELIPSPVLRHALDILDREAPEAQRVGLLHGDYRLPNLMWHQGRISGILDWELAFVGDPLSDLAFTQTVGMGPCSVEGPLADHYTRITGIEVHPKKIIYYKLLEMVKSTIIGLAGAHDLAQGGTDLRLLSVATIALSGQAIFGMLEGQLESYLEADT